VFVEEAHWIRSALERRELPRGGAAAALANLVAPGGFLVVTTPEAYRRTPDPVDTGFRPDPEHLAALLEAAEPALDVKERESLEITDPQRYRGFHSRVSAVPVDRRWLPLPRRVEQLRRRVPPLRWREACVLAQRRG
jgi:hypothetical protein